MVSKQVPESKEVVLLFGVAGGGITIYRTKSHNGGWQYHAETTGMDLDENDDEIWRHSVKQPVAEFEKALQPFDIWPICCPATVHPEYGKMIWEMYWEAKGKLSSDLLRLWKPRNGEQWREACGVEGGNNGAGNMP